jgi:hypothetical protein
MEQWQSMDPTSVWVMWVVASHRSFSVAKRTCGEEVEVSPVLDESPHQGFMPKVAGRFNARFAPARLTLAQRPVA